MGLILDGYIGLRRTRRPTFLVSCFLGMLAWMWNVPSAQSRAAGYSWPLDSLYACTAPPDTLLRCGDPALKNLGLLGKPIVPNLLPENVKLVELPVQNDLSVCGTGVRTRSWQFVQDAGYAEEVRGPVCTQRIQIEAFPRYAMRFPADTTVSCTGVSGVDTLLIQPGDCDFFSVTVQDIPDFTSGNTCFRIRRVYRAINWCEYDGKRNPVVVDRDADQDQQPGDERVWAVTWTDGATYLDRDNSPDNQVPNAQGYWKRSVEDPAIASRGYWEYHQIIYIRDDDAPKIQAPESMQVSATRSDCTGDLHVAFSLVEECAPENLDIEVRLDLYADGLAVEELATALSGTYPHFRLIHRLPLGKHQLIIRVGDACGNSSEKRMDLQVVDRRAPEFKCINSLVLNLSPVAPGVDADGDGDTDNGAVTVWAEELVSSPATDCSSGIRYSVHRAEWIETGFERPNAAQRSIVLTCDDRPTVLLYIYAWDAVGNYSYDETFVLLNDAKGVICPAVGVGSISGEVVTPQGIPLPGALVALAGDKITQTFSGTDGKFSFEHLKEGTAYRLIARQDSACREGVSTFDIVKVLRHILGEESFRSPYQYIAADVDRSGFISTLDIIKMRRLVLGIDACFSNAPSWLLVNAAHQFSSSTSPLQEEVPDEIKINSLSGKQEQTNFIAIKIGDITGDALQHIVSPVYMERPQQVGQLKSGRKNKHQRARTRRN